MADTDTVIPNMLTVERNNVRLALIKTKKRAKKGEPDVYYPGPNKETDKLTLISYFGEDAVHNILLGKFKLIAQNLTNEATSLDGVFDQAKFIKAMAEMDARGETIPVLRERYEELADELASLATSNMTVPANQEKFKKIALEMKAVKDAIENKRRTKEEEEEEKKAA